MAGSYDDEADAAFLSFMQSAALSFDRPDGNYAESRAQAEEPILAPWEQAFAQGAGQGFAGTGVRTGAGKRAFGGPYETTWSPDVPYPQTAPSNTTNEERPRTLAMGYDPSSRIVMTTFRDGTVWQYYNVPPEVWENYSVDPSPGRFIREVLDAYPYGRAPDNYQGR